MTKISMKYLHMKSDCLLSTQFKVNCLHQCCLKCGWSFSKHTDVQNIQICACSAYLWCPEGNISLWRFKAMSWKGHQSIFRQMLLSLKWSNTRIFLFITGILITATQPALEQSTAIVFYSILHSHTECTTNVPLMTFHMQGIFLFFFSGHPNLFLW